MDNRNSERIAFVWWIRFIQTCGDQWASWPKQIKDDFGSVFERDEAEDSGTVQLPLALADPRKWVSGIQASKIWSGQEGPDRPKLYRDGTEVELHHLPLVIDVRRLDDDIHARIATLVKLHREEIGWEKPTGRPTWESRQGRYKLHHRPDNDLLAIVYFALIRFSDNPKQSMWDIGQAITKEFPVAVSTVKATDSDRRRELAKLGSKYINIGRAIQTNVIYGRFPVTKMRNKDAALNVLKDQTQPIEERIDAWWDWYVQNPHTGDQLPTSQDVLDSIDEQSKT